MKKKICVITGNRAEYGLLKKLIFLLNSDKDINLNLVVTGSHISKEFGNTYKEILNDGIKIKEKIPILTSSDKPVDICNSIGKGVIEFSKSLERLKPHIVVLLGDRYELLSVATACLVCQIPIAHIHGGETTLGAIDESIRHSITKMSLLHFVTTLNHKRRVIQLGEDPKKVFHVGGFGHDAISSFKFSKKNQLEKMLNIQFLKKNIIFTYHPVTLDRNESRKQINTILKAIKKFKDIYFIFTMANSDTYGKVINKEIIKFVKKNKNTVFFQSLGQQNYYNCLKYVDAIMGNSSSGILEAPSFNLPVINIGDRQKGRDQANNVINIDLSYSNILNAIKKIYSKEFKNINIKLKSPYGKKNASMSTYKIIKKVNFQNTKKKFFDFYNV